MDKQGRYSRVLSFCGILVLICLVLVACDSGKSGTNAPDAKQLLTNAQDALRKVTAYHFNLNTDNPGNTSGGMTIKTADGDVVPPDKLKAKAEVLPYGVQVQIIAVGDQQYVTNPLTGSWEKAANLLDPRSIADPQTGVANLFGYIQNPSTPTDSSVNGTPCWSIDGKLDAQYLTGITGGGVPSGSTVATTVCIGKSDNLPYQIKVTGVAVQGDNANTARTFKLSNFNETITIATPAAQ